MNNRDTFEDATKERVAAFRTILEESNLFVEKELNTFDNMLNRAMLWSRDWHQNQHEKWCPHFHVEYQKMKTELETCKQEILELGQALLTQTQIERILIDKFTDEQIKLKNAAFNLYKFLVRKSPHIKVYQDMKIPVHDSDGNKVVKEFIDVIKELEKTNE